MDTLILMAYVDGELSPDDAKEVEAQIAHSPEVAAYVEKLAASKLSVERAFARQKLPPIPLTLRAEIDRMGMADAMLPPAAAANDSSSVPTVPRAVASGRSPIRIARGWLAAAFAAGIAVCAVGLNLLSQYGGTDLSPGWVQAAAGYQQLYSRETIDMLALDPQTTARTLSAIRHDDSMAIDAPDLRPDKLQLKRIQRLRFHGNPLAQMVYLPERGAPVALCVMREDSMPDTGVTIRQIDGMRVAHWRSKSLGYALIGMTDGATLSALGRKIANGQVAKLQADG